MEDDFLRKPQTLQEYQTVAQRLLPQPYFFYFNLPGRSGQTSRDSVDAYKRYIFRPHLLRDVSVRKLSTTVLGHPVAFPVGVAPTGNQRLAHQDAEVATAKGAAAAGTLMIQSSISIKSVEEVAAAAPGGLRWMQVYMWKDLRVTEFTIRKAEAAGYQAIVVTVDSPLPKLIFGNNPETGRKMSGFSDPDIILPNLDADTEELQDAKRRGVEFQSYWTNQVNPKVTWDDIVWVKGITSLPVVCKGILTDLAARQAADAGADGIIVSAHGGRQLDGVASPIDALTEVVQALRGRNVEVYMDGGVRTGSDVLKALARGARFVFVGRPIIWGLACSGASGVEHVLNILRNELDSTLGLCGCSDVNVLPRDLVVHESYYSTPKHKL